MTPTSLDGSGRPAVPGTAPPAAGPDPEPPAEQWTDAEERFERLRRRAGLVLAPTAALAIWLSGEATPVRRLAAIMAATGLLWIGESIPLAATAVLAAAATVVAGVATSKEAFAAFGHPLLFLFLGSFLLAEAMHLHGLGERFALGLFRLVRTQLGALVALSFGAFALSMWISNTAATAVLLPVALSVANASRDRRFAAALVLAIAYGASIGGIGTPVGTPPNLIGIAALGEQGGVHVGFARWVALGTPIGLVMLVVLWAVLAWRFHLRRGVPVSGGVVRAPGAWSPGERAVAVSFGLAVTLWIVPGVLELAAPSAAKVYARHLPEEVVAVLASSLLFFWPIPHGPAGGPVGPRRALLWSEAARIDWATILLFGGGILLGDLAGKTGLAARMGEALVGATGVSSTWGITALVTAVAIVLSETTSNTATATLMLPLTISLAKAAGVPVAPAALGATLGASFGFMLPISTAPNAMAFGTGKVSVREMASAGVVFDLIGYVAILAGLRLLCPLLGLA